MPFRPTTSVHVRALARAGRRRITPWLTATLFVCASVPGIAQTTGALQGRVLDGSEAWVLPGATITVRSPATGFARSVAAGWRRPLSRGRRATRHVCGHCHR